MSFDPMGDPGEHRGLPRDLLQDIIKRAAYEAKAREMRVETERRCGGRLSPAGREAVDSVLADIMEDAAAGESKEKGR